jgi:tetratricopeptide (TPR) repeat protein
MIPSLLRLQTLLLLGILSTAIGAAATDTWDSPPFETDPAILQQAAHAIKARPHDECTVFLNDLYFGFDKDGKMKQSRHLIYRIENQDGVKNWAETSGRWEAWHQDKPEIRARVISPEGTVHWLDPKTLNDFPVHEDAPDVYSDDRKYGGPLPALIPGSIIEEEVAVHDTSPLFAAGTVHRWTFAWNVPVSKTRVVISHPISVPLQYEVHLLPDATIRKSSDPGVETITLEQGPLPAYAEDTDHVPPNLILYPEIEFSTGTSWKNVASEYARLSNDKLRSGDVEALISKIKAKNGSRADLIRSIVGSIHKRVRYTGVEFGESSLIPQFPSETLRRGYGDCKDKAALLVTMLRSAGIHASLALLDTGPGRDLNARLPGLGMFDHAIVYVPGVGTDSDLWIDATAQYTQVGTLPWMDYGRWALIIDDSTEVLKQIPDITSTSNVHRELREVTLAEYGMANFVETDDEIGPDEADYREFYSGESKQVREASEGYVKEAYLADSLSSLEHDDLSDLDKPGTVRFITKGKRGNTDLTTALVAIRVESLFDRLPKYFRTKDNDEDTEDSEGKESAWHEPRTADWLLTPFTTEWHYKVKAPLGYKLRALPPDRNEKVGTLSFTQKYSADADGTGAEALLRVENTTTRMSVREAKELREAVLKARSADPIFITFDNVGNSLISAGKMKEGLAAHRDLAAQHPREALHKVQLAQALIEAGLGEEARRVAVESTNLEPKSALAQSTLGMVLKHDLIGRHLKKGMDYEGAVAAYRKAIALDPKDKETRANLALLLEYDKNGTRYNDKARLTEAAAVLRELKKVDEEYSRTYDDNVLYDLWYAGDYTGVLEYAATLPATDVRKGLMLAAIAAQHGSDAALKKSLEMTTEDQGRSKVLANAGAVLVRVRKYPEAAALIAEGARGQSNESQITRSAAAFAASKPYETIAINQNDPRGVVQQLFGEMLSGKLTLEEFKSMVYIDAMESDKTEDEKQFQDVMSKLKSQMAATGLPLVTIADIAVSNMHYTVDGDDSLGYKITIEAPGAAAEDVYVIKDGGNYKVAAFAASGSNIEGLAPLVLRAIENNKLPAARKWLDRARDKIRVSGGDDPLAGPAFPHFWTKGQEADAPTMRIAALVLLRSKAVDGPSLAALDQARQAAKTDLERHRLTMVMAYAYAAHEKWADMLPLTAELMKSLPTSLRAFELATTAFAGLKRLDDWDNLIQSRTHEDPDELAYVRSSARLAAYRNQFGKSRDILKGIIDKGHATENDLNLYAWYALLRPDPIEQGTLDSAQRANDLTKNANFAILHTLACLDAQSGKTSQSRDLLLKAMEAQHLEEPNSEVWFGFGLIAEQYGVIDAAEKMYSRVEKPKLDYPGTSYVIAQQHLTNLRGTPSNSRKPVGQ